MAASAGTVSLRRRVSSGGCGPRRSRRSFLFRLVLDWDDGLRARPLAYSPRCRQHHLGRDHALYSHAVGGRRVLAHPVLAWRWHRPDSGFGVRRRLARPHLARPKVAQPRPLARSGFVVWLLSARRPDREPRRLGSLAQSKGRSRPSPHDGAKTPRLPRRGESRPSTRAACKRQPSSALRAEHDRLQARIHAMDQNYGSRVPAPGRPDGGEWAQLRELGRNARRLFEIQEAEMLGPAGSRGAGRSRAQQPNGTTLAASVHPPRAGHAPARAPGRRQRRP